MDQEYTFNQDQDDKDDKDTEIMEVDNLRNLYSSSVSQLDRYHDKTLETFLKDFEKSKADIELNYNIIPNIPNIPNIEDNKHTNRIKHMILFKKSFIPSLNHSQTDKDEKDIALYNIYNEKIKKYSQVIEQKIDISEKINEKNISQAIVKGNIQSGKTEYMTIIMLYIVLFVKRSVIIIVRNYTQDKRQFAKRINEFKDKYGKIYKEIENVCVVENVLCKKIQLDGKPKIYILLDNRENIARMNKINILTETRYSIIFDEADLTDSSEDHLSRDRDISFLKKNSDQIVWVSGTVIDKLVKEEGIKKEDIVILKTPKDYKSILSSHIKMIKVEGEMVNNSTKNVFESNPDIHLFLEEYIKKPVFESQPRICLFSVTNIQKVMNEFQNEIEERFPNLFSTIVYNGEGTMFRKGNKIIRMSNGISDCLQFLKMNGDIDVHHHILIISGLLASRGISFVSDDYNWHLSEQYSIISKTTNEADMLQKIRLHGVYKDDIPLILYTNVVSDILKAVYKQEELIFSCKEKCDDKDSKTLLKDINLSEDKFSKNKKLVRSITRSVPYKPNRVKGDDGGWSTDIYKKKKVVPENVFHLYDMTIMTIMTINKDIKHKKIITDDDEDDEDDKKNNEDLILSSLQDSREDREKPAFPLEKKRISSLRESGDKRDDKEMGEDKNTIYITLKDVSKQTKETYDLIVEYFDENYKSSWVQRSIISKYFQEKGHSNIARINARFEHLIAKGNKDNKEEIEECLVFKKEQNRWYIKIIKI